MRIELCRTVRFCLNPDGSLAWDAPATNTFAAWPPMRGLGRYYALHVACRGEADARTGYLLNIKHIDQAVREAGLPRIAAAAREDGGAALGELLRSIHTALARTLHCPVTRVGLQLAPTLCYTLLEVDMSRVLIAQQYDFSAAHRLHVPSLSPERNREIFGKCNNPAGHGHNYRLEVTVAAPIADDGSAIDVELLDALVDRTIIDRFDHKHLNEDIDDFAGINPSVENIARRCYQLLDDAVKQIDVELDQVRVWETDKTVATYRGG